MPCQIFKKCGVRWYMGMVRVTNKPFRNRNIEYFDFHFSRVLCSTKITHLRRLGINRFHFSITISFDCSGFGFFLYFSFTPCLHPFYLDSCISFRMSSSPPFFRRRTPLSIRNVVQLDASIIAKL